MAWGLVQSSHLNRLDSGEVTTIAKAFPSNVVAGNLLLAWFTWGYYGSVETPNGCADTVGSTWTRLPNTATVDAANRQQAVLYWAIAAGSGPNTVTLTNNLADRGNGAGWRNYPAAEVAEFSGNHASPADQSNGASQAAVTAVSSGNITPIVDGCLVVSFTINTSAGTSAITEESTVINDTGATDGCSSQYEVQASAAAIAGDFTATSGNYVTCVASFKPASGATATATLTGTAAAGITEADIVTGGKTIILTLTGGTFIA